MHDALKNLQLWQQKDQIARQVETIAESDDWYRGGRKIGRLRRSFKTVAAISPEVETFFEERLNAAHQTYMDRLALHKLKGPTNQEALKKAEIGRIENQSRLFRVAIAQAEGFIDDCRQRLVNGDDGGDRETAGRIIDGMVAEIAHKRNRIRANGAMVELLESGAGYVGCSATIGTVARPSPPG